MSRVSAGVLVAGLALMGAGLIMSSSSWGVALVVVGAALVAGFYAVVGVRAVRTHGATWDVNPGAARREAAREREARERATGRAGDE
jgi:protein-S-isoprenylcysteine O-methyltransferase Ste14